MIKYGYTVANIGDPAFNSMVKFIKSVFYKPTLTKDKHGRVLIFG